MSAYDADDLLERASLALDRDIPTLDEVKADLADALDKLERDFTDGRPPRGARGLERIEYSNAVSKVNHCRWLLENGQCVEFPRGRRSRLDPGSDDSSWTEFLAEHPELSTGRAGETVVSTTERPPLTFTDAELLKALRQACRAWGRRFPERRSRGVHSSSVAWVLVAGVSDLDGRASIPPEQRPSTRDVTRVGVALARLAREGRVERTNRKWESNSWAPKRKTAPREGGRDA